MNIFGPWGQYDTDTLSSFYPKEHLDLIDDLFDDAHPSGDEQIMEGALVHPCKLLFGPYPNQNSFLLGEWYWHYGIQKSQENFKSLLKIVGDERF